MPLTLVVDFLEVFRSTWRANVKQRIASPFDLHQTSAKADEAFFLALTTQQQQVG
jgi:hypothetical protein